MKEQLPEGMKRCPKCGAVKPFDMFDRDRSTKSGLASACKTCRLAYRDSNREKINEGIERWGRSNLVREHIEIPDKKQCPRCQEVKPSALFARTRRTKDGLASHCKTCTNAYHSQRDKSEVRAYNRARKAALASRDHIHYPEEKKCPRCGEIKPKEMFYLTPTQKSGLSTYCKMCQHGLNLIRPVAILPPSGVKRCFNCGETKTIESFQRNRSSRDGLTSRCKTCVKVYRDLHREILRARDRFYSAKHRAEKHARYHRWISVNPDYHRLKRLKHADRYRAYLHNRRARMKANGGKLTASDLAHIRHIQDGHCCYCSRVTALTIEHIIPVTRDGSSNDPWNIALACWDCNRSKGDRLLEEWTDRWYLS